VLAAQEVGDPEALAELLSRPQLDGCYPHVLLGKTDHRGICVALISKLRFEDPTQLIEFPPLLDLFFGLDDDNRPIPVDRFSRGALVARVRPFPDRPIALMTAHLKSKLLSYSSKKSGKTRFSPRCETERVHAAAQALILRTAEAAALRARANQFLEGNSENDLILLGDFNDGPEAATTQILAGPTGSEVGTRGYDRPDRGDDSRLFNLALYIGEKRRYSRVHDASRKCSTATTPTPRRSCPRSPIRPLSGAARPSPTTRRSRPASRSSAGRSPWHLTPAAGGGSEAVCLTLRLPRAPAELIHGFH
jgi:hypothetical protein